MSGECNDCGEHTLDCRCKTMPRCGDYYPDHSEDVRVMVTGIRDELTRVRGLVLAIRLLHKQGEHKVYRLDPVEDLGILLDERIDKIEEGLKKL